MPKQDKLSTLFGNAVTSQAYMEVWVGNVGPIRGYLVRKVGQKESALSLRQLQSTVLGAKSEEALVSCVKKSWKAKVRRCE